MPSAQESFERVIYKGEVEEKNRIILEVAKAERDETKKELHKAKEKAVQSWLDSEPLIDELEKQKANLANAQQNSKTPKTDILELESQLEIIQMNIKSKRDDHLKTEKMIYEINHALDQARNEMERLKLNIKKEKQTRAKLKQTLHLRRRAVQTLQLTLQAVLLESDAVEVSKAEAFRQISHSENHTSVVQLNHKDCYDLTRRAEERTSQANWRVSISAEQKLAAEATHELALSKLNHFYSSRTLSTKRRNTTGQLHKEKDANIKDAIVQEEITTNINSALPKSHAKSLVKSEGGESQHSRRSPSNIKTTKKSSILYKMRKCLQKMIRKMGG
ncbi:unnamed protein product [Lathyrus oleraceus]|uniref:uncharacterized protein LOC127136635 n=1 Tax=Pisum sativum TaxID=3888 RepID=UPI001FC424B8|nr:uncharacterized protein LOC127136635 [Pisum sativum]